MGNNAEKEKWIDEVLQSANGMQRAQPGAGLYERAYARAGQPQRLKTRPLPVTRWAAAALLLLALNVGSVVHFIHENNTATAPNNNSLAMGIPSVTTYNY